MIMENYGNDKLLTIDNLKIHYVLHDSTVEAVNGISLDIKKGETLGLVGETGAGKTTVALGIMGLLPDPPARIIDGSVEFGGDDLFKKSAAEMRKIRGNKISMIFQDPMSALNPIDTVGEQIMEGIRLHEKITKREAYIKACEILELVGIPADRYSDYPHQFSGGMKQRIVIAMAMVCEPDLLIADEPTTALDVTIQAQVLEMVNEIQQKTGTSMILITHDLGVIAEMTERVAIIYAGRIVEIGTTEQIYTKTMHPYTIGLFGSLPRLDSRTKRLEPIPGLMPDPSNLPKGCSFAPRCPKKIDICEMAEPELSETENGHCVRCHLYTAEDK